ncbi:MAG: MCE family protein [Rhodospirillales bacterium]|nr:MCE family protein [Rhodospirillales bacterium]
METRAHYLLVGLFVLLLGIGLLGFAVWLIGAQQPGDSTRHAILYEGSVTGLRTGGPVRLNGVKVGSVADIALDPKQLGRVRILVDIGATVPLKTDSIASLELEGLTGGRYILLTGGTAAAPVLKKNPGEEYPVIASRPSSIDELLEDVPNVLANVNRLLLQATALVSDRNVRNLSNTLEDLSLLSASLAGNREEIDSIVKRIGEAAKSVDSTAASVERLTALLEQDGQRIVDKTETAIGKIDRLADSLNATAEDFSRDLGRITDQAVRGTVSFGRAADQVALLIEENREPISDFTSQGLFAFIDFLAEARGLIGNLKTITADVGRDPSRFFFGNTQDGYVPR